MSAVDISTSPLLLNRSTANVGEKAVNFAQNKELQDIESAEGKDDKGDVRRYRSELNRLLVLASAFSLTNVVVVAGSYVTTEEDRARIAGYLLHSIIRQSSDTYHYHPDGPTRTSNTSTTILPFSASLLYSMGVAITAAIKRRSLHNTKWTENTRTEQRFVVKALSGFLWVSANAFFVGTMQYMTFLDRRLVVGVSLLTSISMGVWLAANPLKVSCSTIPSQAQSLTRSEEVTTAQADVKISAEIQDTMGEEPISDHPGLIIRNLVGSRFQDGHVYFDISMDTLQHTISTLQDLSLVWNINDHLVHQEDHGNRAFILTLSHGLWGLLLEGDGLDGTSQEVVLGILERLYMAQLARQGLTTGLRSSRCITWFRRSASQLEVVRRVTKVFLFTPMTHPTAVGGLLSLLLQMTWCDGNISLGASQESLWALIPVLKDVISDWDKENDLVHQEDSSNALFLKALSIRLWSMLQHPNWTYEESVYIILEILERLSPVGGDECPWSRPKSYTRLLSIKPISLAQKLRCLYAIDPQLKSLKLAPANSIPHHPIVYALLFTTMCERDGILHLNVADVRVAWILEDFDLFYSSIVDSCFSQYLSEWRRRMPQPQSYSAEPLAYTVLYLRSILRLLTKDQDLWAIRLRNDGHLTHLWDIIKDGSQSKAHALCLICCILLVNASAFQNSELDDSYFTEKWASISGSNLLSFDKLALLESIDSIAPQSTEAIHLVRELWRFLVIGFSLGHIEAPQMGSIHCQISAYLVKEANNRSGSQPKGYRLVYGLQDPLFFQHIVPATRGTSNPRAAGYIETSSSILAIPDTDKYFRLFAAELFSRALLTLHLDGVSNWEAYLRYLGKAIQERCESFIETLETEQHVGRISGLLGASSWNDGTSTRLREMQWWCLRLFLTLWGRRRHKNPSPYTDSRSFLFITSFFESLDNRVDVFEAQRSIDEVPQTTLTALGFMESACTYFEFVKTKRGLRIPPKVISSYRETCGHSLVSGASRWKEYLGWEGEDNWKQDITPLLARVNTLLEQKLIFG